MRRTAVTLAVLAVLMVFPNPAAAPSEGPVYDIFEIADASWFVRENGKPALYVGGATRTTDPAGRTRTYGFADKLKCWEKRTRTFAVTICFGTVRPQKMPSDRFEFDPLLDQTTVSFEGNRMTFTGRGQHEPDFWPAADPNFGAIFEASLNREARVDGRVLGLEMKTRGWKDWGYLSEGAFGGVITAENRKVTYNSDGTITFRMKVRQPL